MNHREHVEFYWKLVTHENNFINYRFFWGVFVNAGLLTFFTNDMVRQGWQGKMSIAVFGFAWSLAIAVMCIAALRAERASLDAIERILAVWTFPELPGVNLVPLQTLRGGGSLPRHNLAAVLSYSVFLAMPAFWAVIAVLVWLERI